MAAGTVCTAEWGVVQDRSFPALSIKKDNPFKPNSRQDAGSQPSQEPTKQQQAFAKVSQQHLSAVVQQLLHAEGIADVSLWQPIVTKLATEAADAVQPSALAAFGVADPRYFIKVSGSVSTYSLFKSCIAELHLAPSQVIHSMVQGIDCAVGSITQRASQR